MLMYVRLFHWSCNRSLNSVGEVPGCIETRLTPRVNGIMDDNGDIARSEETTPPELIAGRHEMCSIKNGDGDNRNTLARSKDESARFEALEKTVEAPCTFGEKKNGTISVQHLRTGA